MRRDVAHACGPFRRLPRSAWHAFSVGTDLIVLAIVVLAVLSYLAAGRV
jgi:hypothetical protein